MPAPKARKTIRKILDPIRPGLLRTEDIRDAVRAVAAEEAANGGRQRTATKTQKKASPARRDAAKSLP